MEAIHRVLEDFSVFTRMEINGSKSMITYSKVRSQAIIEGMEVIIGIPMKQFSIMYLIAAHSQKIKAQ